MKITKMRILTTSGILVSPIKKEGAGYYVISVHLPREIAIHLGVGNINFNSGDRDNAEIVVKANNPNILKVYTGQAKVADGDTWQRAQKSGDVAITKLSIKS